MSKRRLNTEPERPRLFAMCAIVYLFYISLDFCLRALECAVFPLVFFLLIAPADLVTNGMQTMPIFVQIITNRTQNKTQDAVEPMSISNDNNFG